MKTNITELVFILDKRGSMAGFESDTKSILNGEQKILPLLAVCLVGDLLF